MADSLNTTNPSRRAILSAAPSVAAAAAIGVGLGAPALSHDADAELVSLDKEFGVHYRKWIVLRLKEWRSEEREDHGADALLSRWHEIATRAMELRPSSITGIAAKASILLCESQDMNQHADMWDVAEDDLDWDILVPLRFVSELRELAGLGSAPFRNI